MEHSFKRRRVSWRAGGSAGIHRFMRDGPVTSDKQPSELFGPGFKSQPSGAPHSPKQFSETVTRSRKDSTVEEGKLSHLHPRNLVPAKVKEAVQAPSQTVVASVVQVVVNDGAGSKVTELLVPVSSKVVSVQGFAPITLGRATAAASAVPSVAASPRNPHEQHSSPTPVAAPKSYATETAGNAASRTESPPRSQPTGSAYGNPLSISVSGSNSQVVLSSPPSTPLPSSPASTTTSSSTASYFSSSPSASSAPASSASSTSNPGAASTSSSSTVSWTAATEPAQTSNVQSSPAPSQSNSNSTTTSSTLSGASTTSTDSSLINPIFSTFNANSTLVTSTSSRPTFTSSVSLTSSGLSSRSSSTLLSSTSGSSTASRTTSSSLAASSTQTSTFDPTSSASSIGGAVGGIGGAGSTASAPSSSASSGAGSGGGGNSINTPAVVGGVVGGLAGVAIILVLLLFLIRWRRRKSQRRTISPPLPQSHPPGVANTAPTTQRSSVVPFASGGFFRRMRPGSGQTAETTETSASERGFQNFGGRRLESVLSSRGDGYSDPVPPSGVAPRGYAGTATGLGLAAGVASPASRQPGPGPLDNETLSGSSFYRDSQGFYGGNEAGVGPSSPPPTSPTSGAGSPPGEGFAVTRPGPARTPVINQPGFAAHRPPPGTGRGTPPPIGRGTTPPGTGRGTPAPRNLTSQPRQQDEVGRSQPSFDGSRGSRFAEAV